jgi:hypothetical protein
MSTDLSAHTSLQLARVEFSEKEGEQPGPGELGHSQEAERRWMRRLTAVSGCAG